MTFLRLSVRRGVAALVLVILASLSSFAQQPGSGASASSVERKVRVTLLQLNDVYQISAVDKGTRGGLARVATLRKQVMAESPNTLFLLGGDTIAPSVASNIFKGQQMINVWNMIGLDFAVLGNHEFDFGPQVLQDRIKESRFTWLATNVIDKKSGKPFADTPPYVIREIGGAKIGFFGLLTPDTAQFSSVGPDVTFLDPCETARKIVPEMRTKGAQVVVAITHLAMREDKQVARCAPIDVIIGGHEHEMLESLSGRTPIFKWGADARDLGRIDLNIKLPSGELESIDWTAIPVTSEVKDDPQSAALIADYENKVSADVDRSIGSTRVALDARGEMNRSRETNLGSYIADAYRKALKADVALFNGGSIRAGKVLSPGPLSKRDVMAILPYENPIVKIEVTGATLRAALEHGVSRSAEEKEPGRFPQVSGVRFTFDARRPAGSRLTSVEVGGQPLDDKKIYTLATNTFLAEKGGDGYTMLIGSKYLVNPENGPVEPVVLMEAISAEKEIAPQADGRIKREDQ
ncbi:MAG TPA: bifunctional UDP-sugar hydrolase/5'-nucleotidase [Pyrinomonadaceae bacterium]|nr:bifunctional UDP-sugar hydrolase/5'-nucleotidase [Pyrinomonadaceae bacterium]